MQSINEKYIMSSVNKAILIGNVGQDPEVRYLERGVAVATFPLATTERGFVMQNGVQVPDKTEWHNIVLWRNLAEWGERYIRKSMKLYVEGKLQTRSWEKDGVRKQKTEIIAENVQILASGPAAIYPGHDHFTRSDRGPISGYPVKAR